MASVHPGTVQWLEEPYALRPQRNQFLTVIERYEEHLPITRQAKDVTSAIRIIIKQRRRELDISHLLPGSRVHPNKARVPAQCIYSVPCHNDPGNKPSLCTVGRIIATPPDLTALRVECEHLASYVQQQQIIQ